MNLPEEVVGLAYRLFWKYIKTSIKELPLKEDLSKEEFDKLKPNFNIPSIGKLHCTYEEYLRTKKQLEIIKYNTELKNDRIEKNNPNVYRIGDNND